MGEKGTKKLKEKGILDWQRIENSSIIFIRLKAKKTENGKCYKRCKMPKKGCNKWERKLSFQLWQLSYY